MSADSHVHSPPACPEPRRLLAFSAGSLCREEREAIAEHVETCDRCLRVLSNIDTEADPLVQLLRAAFPAESGPEVSTERLVDGAAALAELTSASVAGHSRRPEVMSTWVSRQLGDYVLEEEIGRGGMGTVFRSRHRILNKTVAIKVIARHRVGDPRAVQRFRREIETLGSLDHPNIIRALDAREEGGVLFLIMEYLEGSDLARLIARRGGLPVSDACEVIRQAARGLHFVHEEQGLVHRDIKPSNLMITPSGCVKILDLGLALLSSAEGERDREAARTLTEDGDIIGSTDYMAPEQWRGSHSVDRRADLYSLGCTLYDMLAGVPPFAAPAYDTPAKKLMAHANEQPPPIREFRPDVPKELVAILARLLAKDPAERYSSAAEVAEALLPLSGGHHLPCLLGLPRSGGLIDRGGGAPAQDVAAPAKPESLARRPVEQDAAIPPAHEDRHEGHAPSCEPLRRTLKAWQEIAIGSAVIVSLLGVTLWRAGALDRDPRTPLEPGYPGATPTDLKAPSPSVPGPSIQTRPDPEIRAELRVHVYRLDPRDKEALVDLGELGRSVSVPRRGDRLVVSADFSRPVYPYLIAVNPDGSWENVEPAPADLSSAKQATSLRHPSGNQYLTLDDPGFTALVLLLSSRPLARDETVCPPIDADRWRSTAVTVPWSSDGHRLDPLSKQRIGRSEHGPRAFLDLSRSMASRPGVVAVRATAFSVAEGLDR